MRYSGGEARETCTRRRRCRYRLRGRMTEPQLAVAVIPPAIGTAAAIKRARMLTIDGQRRKRSGCSDGDRRRSERESTRASVASLAVSVVSPAVGPSRVVQRAAVGAAEREVIER